MSEMIEIPRSVSISMEIGQWIGLNAHSKCAFRVVRERRATITQIMSKNAFNPLRYSAVYYTRRCIKPGRSFNRFWHQSGDLTIAKGLRRSTDGWLIYANTRWLRVEEVQRPHLCGLTRSHCRKMLSKRSWKTGEEHHLPLNDLPSPSDFLLFSTIERTNISMKCHANSKEI